MAFSTSSILKPPTVLEQLLDEINFQRTKEMRQMMTDDSEFVMLQGTTYWTDLFVRHFLFQNESTIDCDDLLFFVRKKHVKGSPRYLPKFETEVDVFRKDSRKLPIGDPDIDWEETVYLNLIIHQFEYTLTLAICTRTSPKELQVLKRHSQKVYASPSRRRMDTKGEVEEITYPHVCFMVDNFDEVFQDILVRDGEMVCVELVASDRTGSIQGVIFLGSIRYDALKKVYDARQSSLSSKMAQRMMFGLFSNVNSQRCEFVRMKGPQGKGHAEMAVTKPKGSGVETPTSEPGFCATDMWDDWEDDANEEYFTFRQQRRLSDPSANINNFVRGGWKTKLDVKSRSECEGLDSMDNGVSEIEAGDLRDEEVSGPTSNVATIKISTAKSSCCGCFQRPSAISCCTSRSRASSIALTEICGRRACTTPHACAVRSPLGPPEHHCNCNQHQHLKAADSTQVIKVQSEKPANANYTEFEFADDAIILNQTEHISHHETNMPSNTYQETSLNENPSSKSFVTVHGKEELPFVQEEDEAPSISPPASAVASNNGKTESVQMVDANKSGPAKNTVENDVKVCDGNLNRVQTKPIACSTLPKRKNSLNRKNKLSDKQHQFSPPKRITPDGTHIYYWCDMSKKHPSELDDGAYNPLWTMRGFTQTFHFWKENKRAQSVPLNAFLTYVTLPWWSIAKDILDHREGPILTF